MKIICGLGNPGKKFKMTRHNLGFLVLDFFAKKEKFPKFKLEKKFQAKISKKGEILLVKPQTFMNNSGKALKFLIANLRLKIEDLIVIHDDIDLPLGKIKIVKNRGAAGHKGVESIIKELGTKNFIRFRIGIQPKIGKPKNVEKFVLQKFNKEEKKILKEVIKKAVEAIEVALIEGIEKAMNKYNTMQIYE